MTSKTKPDKKKLLTQKEEYRYTGEHLLFEECTNGHWTLENKDFENLGYLENQKVGRWNGWCLYLDKDCYLSAGCLDEVREMISILNSKQRRLS